MPEFDFAADEPIVVTIVLDIGRAQISAGDHARTAADVHPSDSSNPCDVATAGLARVTYTAGELMVAVPAGHGPPGSGSVIVDVRVPSGSRVHANALAADFHGTGRLGTCRIVTGCGHIRLDQTGPLYLSSDLGNISVERAVGGVEAAAGSGDISIREIDGPAQVHRRTGNTRIGELTGDLRVCADRGDLHVGRAHSGVEASAARGDIRIDETVHGLLLLETGCGRLDIGIAHGSDAILDLNARVGTVYRALDLVDGVAPAHHRERTVEVRSRTGMGDIVVRRGALGHDLDWR